MSSNDVPGSDLHGIEKYRDYLGPRYRTFRHVFDEFVRIGGRTIVELGTSRSFVSDAHPGCMVDDSTYWQPDRPETWDWGAGLFTRMCAEQLQGDGPTIHTVDISPSALDICRVITADFRDSIQYHLCSSEEFLLGFSKPIDLLYMDAGETGNSAAELHLREARLAVSRQLFSPRAIVLVDDVNIPGVDESKGRYSIPYLCEQGFERTIVDYQVVLQLAAGGMRSS